MATKKAKKAPSALPPLATLVAPMVRPKKKPAPVDAATAGFLPWLDRHGPKELRAWNALAQKHHLAIPYGKVSVSRAYTFSHAVAGVEDDGCWVARVRAIFCGLSPIAEEDEELHLASWWSYQDGNAVTFYTHQDEREIQGPMPSIASYLVQRYENWDDPEELPFPKEWLEAAKAKTKGWSERVAYRAAPPHLSILHLQPRTDWIVQIFLDLTWDDEPLDAAPTFGDWAKEKELTKKWPHLQAYWLLHHLVWDNREELPALVAMAELRYPAVKELVSWAKLALAGKPIKAKIWDDERVRGFRARTADRKASPMSTAALARLGSATAGARDEHAKAKLERGKLAANKKNASALALFTIAEGLAGKVPALEEALNERFNGHDRDAKMMVFLWNRRGHASLLRLYLTDLATKVTPAFSPFFEALVRRGADFAENHEENVFGALAGLGFALGDWAKFTALVSAIYGKPPSELTRLRRLEIAVVAQNAFTAGDRRGLDFLREEAARFAAEIDEWKTDTAVTSLAFVVRQRDPKGIALWNEMMIKAKPSGANWSILVVFCKIALEEARSKVLLPGLRAMVAKGLGRHDDGERALVCRAFMACGGTAEDLETAIAEDRDVRTACVAAAIAAGLVEAGETTAKSRAAAALDALLAKGTSIGSMELGAAISLLQALAAKKIGGFGASADRVLARAKKQKYAKKSLVRWLEENRPTLA